MIVDPGLKEFTTPQFAKIIDMVNSENGYRPAARKSGMNESSIRSRVKTLTKQAVMQGYSPEHHMTRKVPEPLMVKRISSNYDRNGNLAQQWVIAQPDAEARLRVLMEVIENLKDDIPKVKTSKPPLLVNTSLCNLYTFTDYHAGMLASFTETGVEWNLEKSRDFIIQMFEYMMRTTPLAGVGLINILGDFLHQDSIMPVTPTHGHILDAAARFPDIVRAVVYIIRTLITMALERHSKVVVVLAEGNHDITSSIWLREMFSVMYENDERVEIIRDGTPYYAYQHGETMLGFHHGHLKKKESLPLLFATRYRTIWGATLKRYIHGGHNHHVHEVEHSGVKFVQHPTLAPADAHAFRGGYDSEREATVDTYHIKYGRVNRKTVTPEMLMIQ